MQKTNRVTLRLALKGTLDLDRIDTWLGMVPGIDPDLFDEHRFVPEKPQVAERLAWRVLLLARFLFQSVGLPHFDAGRVVGTRGRADGDGRWDVGVELVVTGNLPEPVYGRIVNAAIGLTFWMGDNRPDEATRERLYAIMEREVRPLSRLVRAGTSTLPILKAAYEAGIPFHHLGGSIYQLGWGSRARKIQRGIVDSDSAIGAMLGNDKVLSSQIFREAGLPAPDHGVATTEKEAIEIARRLSWPLVVKPALGERGEGVSIDINDEAALRGGFSLAQEKGGDARVIVERQVSGMCHRLVILRGQLLYAVKRHPKSVIGDGEKSIRQLIREANEKESAKPPWHRKPPFPSDETTTKTLAEAGYTMDSVVAPGTIVHLRRIASARDGGIAEDVTEDVHQDNRDIAIRAAALCGLRVAGIDIITEDISVPWYKNGAIINEINYSPQLGSGEVSQSCLPGYLKAFVTGEGRIPIRVVVGGERAMQVARRLQRRFIDDGARCFVTSHETTLDATPKELALASDGLYRRCLALLLRNDVDAIVLVVQTFEILETGLPLDRVDEVAIVDRKLSPARSAASGRKEFDRLFTRLRRQLDAIRW